ncbi:MAG: hypothetical protein M8349_02480 [ANME-2 cluster archaeon]|nr:hypothetical protein [ANME-2 cluster archaeon]
MLIKNIVIILLIVMLSLSYSGCLKAPDTDGDGHRDPVDAFPEDPYDWEDSDGDGIGNNAEKDIGTNPYNPDSDGDSYIDSIDLYPLNASIGIDSDGDGYHDAVDAFPDNSGEWADTDGDGYGDNSDKYPEDPMYHTSTFKNLTQFSYEELTPTTIFENNSQGAEYTISITNNDTLGGNFIVTVETCNAPDWTKQECKPGTKRGSSNQGYIGPGETRTVKVKVFSEYLTQRRTYMYWITVTPPIVEQPV